MKFAVMLICVFVINAPGQTAQATNSDDIYYDNCFINTHPQSALLIHDHSGTTQFDYFDDTWTVLASTSYRPRSTRVEISEIDSGGNGGLEADSNPILTYFDKIVSWIKDTYRGPGCKRQLWLYPTASIEFWIGRSSRNQEEA